MDSIQQREGGLGRNTDSGLLLTTLSTHTAQKQASVQTSDVHKGTQEEANIATMGTQ